MEQSEEVLAECSTHTVVIITTETWLSWTDICTYCLGLHGGLHSVCLLHDVLPQLLVEWWQVPWSGCHHAGLQVDMSVILILVQVDISPTVTVSSCRCEVDVSHTVTVWLNLLLPRSMECRRGLAMRILSVRSSVKRVDCDKTEEKLVQTFISYERIFSLVFWEQEWLVGRPLLPEILSQPAPVGAKWPILNR